MIGFLLLAAAVAAVASPFVRPPREADPGADRRLELELAKQNKYRQIRDLELDRKAGKLGERQWAELDRELRREAAAILAEIDSGSPVGKSAAAVSEGTG